MIAHSHGLMRHHWVIQDQVSGLTTPTVGKLLLQSLIFNYSHRKFESSGFNSQPATGNFCGESW